MEGVTIEDRHKREKHFFATTTPWTDLKRSRVGINALRTFLGTLLYNHINGEFPGVVKDIEKLSLDTQKELELLGPSRQTSADQRRFLTRISNAYQKDVMLALNGNYDAGLDADSPLKLRMQVRKMNDRFASTMAQKGHTRIFINVDGTIDGDYVRSGGDNENIIDWIRNTYRDERGTELPGLVNPTVIENLFRQQSSRWESISVANVKGVIAIVQNFNKVVMNRLVSDEEMRTKLMLILACSESELLARTLEQMAEIIHDERGGILQTVNHYYADTLSAIREERVLARLKARGFHDGSAFNMDVVMRSVHLSNEDQTVNDIHDILKAYYKVAMKRYTDNIVLQIVERRILGTGGPVKAFSPDMVGGLDDEELLDIAGENFATSSARNDLLAKYERFQKALEIAKQVRP